MDFLDLGIDLFTALAVIITLLQIYMLFSILQEHTERRQQAEFELHDLPDIDQPLDFENTDFMSDLEQETENSGFTPSN